MAKFRKVQTELEESAERADVAENQLGKLRAKTRSSVSVTRTSPGVSDRNKKKCSFIRLFFFFSVKFVNQQPFVQHQSFVQVQFVNVKIDKTKENLMGKVHLLCS